MSTEKSVADRVFDAITEEGLARDAADEALIAAAGFDYHDPKNWPCEDFSYDPYDSSFEFRGVKDGWRPTPEVLDKFWALGFMQCWICDWNSPRPTDSRDHEAHYAAPRHSAPRPLRDAALGSPVEQKE